MTVSSIEKFPYITMAEFEYNIGEKPLYNKIVQGTCLILPCRRTIRLCMGPCLTLPCMWLTQVEHRRTHKAGGNHYNPIYKEHFENESRTSW